MSRMYVFWDRLGFDNLVVVELDKELFIWCKGVIEFKIVCGVYIKCKVVGIGGNCNIRVICCFFCEIFWNYRIFGYFIMFIFIKYVVL